MGKVRMNPGQPIEATNTYLICCCQQMGVDHTEVYEADGKRYRQRNVRCAVCGWTDKTIDAVPWELDLQKQPPRGAAAGGVGPKRVFLGNPGRGHGRFRRH